MLDILYRALLDKWSQLFMEERAFSIGWSERNMGAGGWLVDL